jgi:hypothetical protein
MNVLKRKPVYTFCAILVLLFGGNVFGADESLLPAGLTMEDVFKPGCRRIARVSSPERSPAFYRGHHCHP